MELGTVRVARRFARAMSAIDAPEMDEDDNPLIPGFKFIGSGAFRYVYLHKNSGVVYKWGDADANTDEERQSHRLFGRVPLSAKGWAVRIPMAYHWGDFGFSDWSSVLTMEYARDAVPSQCSCNDWELIKFLPNGDIEHPPCTTDPCHRKIAEKVGRWAKLGDVHAYNLLWAETQRLYWLVDMGENSNW